jgi:OOP family OmpA-OmpF porin
MKKSTLLLALSALSLGLRAQITAPSFKMYSNYDFLPGEKIIFEDNFTDDQDGEFPAHWILQKGQGIINKVNNDPAFFLTEGNYVRASPRMKTEKGYLPQDFTIEFDFYTLPDHSAIPSLLFTTSDDQSRNIQFGKEVGRVEFVKI